MTRKKITHFLTQTILLSFCLIMFPTSTLGENNKPFSFKSNALNAGISQIAEFKTVAPIGNLNVDTTNQTTGYTTVNYMYTTEHQSGTLTGTVPAICGDVTVVFEDGSYLDSDLHPGYVTLDGSGNWSVNLAGSPYKEHGYQGVAVLSCWNGEDWLYGDIHWGAYLIIPVGCDGNCVPIYRFYNFKQGAHFFTSNYDEAINVSNTAGWTFRYEGVSNFGQYSQAGGTIPVHRFYNFRQGVHFYTANQAEATNLNNTAGWTFRYEGIAYYTYPTQVANTLPVHRFYNFLNGVHFYTSNQAEATYLNDNACWTFRYEGISFYNKDE